MKIYSFGQKENEDFWYANQEGNRTKCGEEMIDSLWRVWVVTKGVSKEFSEDGYTVFNSPTPLN